MRRGPVCIALVLLGLAGAPPAVASPEANALAQQRYDEGIAALDKQDFEAARLSLLQAYAIDPQPRYLFSLAVAEEKAGHALEALGHLRQYEALPTTTDADRGNAAAAIAEAAGKVGHVRVEAPPSTAIVIDGKASAGVTPLSAPIDLAPGRHTLEARLGANVASTVVSPQGGETVVWQLQFALAAPTVPAPAPATNLTPTYDTPSGKPPASARWLASAGLFVAGLGTVAVMGGFLAAANDEADRWSVLAAHTGACPQPPMNPQCTALKESADRRVTDQNAAIGLGITAGALAVAAVVTFLVWPERKAAAPRAWIGPLLAPRGGGAQWSLAF